MRRTTICRSSRAVVLALVAVPLVCPVLRAQDTTQAAPAAPQQQGSGTHTVVAGETLWSIAITYFGDPLLWPEIYRLNTTVVEDPHWIYPGEVLTLGGIVVAQAPTGDTTTTVAQHDTTPPPADTVHAQPSAADTVVAAPTESLPPDTVQAAPVVEEPPPPPSTEGYQTVFDQRMTKAEEVRAILRAYADQPYRPLRRGEFYAAGFLSESEKLPWATVIGGTAQPAITRLSQRTSAQPFDEIAIQPPANASYHVGDSLLIARVDRELVDWGEVVVPLGVARVTAVQSQQVLAEILPTMQFGRIHDGHLALPLEPFRDPGQVRPTAVAQGLEGHVITARDVHPLVATGQYIFIDKGRADGVTLGDIFEVYRPESNQVGGASENVRVTMMVVHAREHSATAIIVGVANPDIPSGTPVRLVKKMPS